MGFVKNIESTYLISFEYFKKLERNIPNNDTKMMKLIN